MSANTRKPTPEDTATRTRLLDAGAELFGKKGFNGCGLSEILAQAGVPKGSFYHYFTSKEEFSVVVIERTRDEFLAELGPLLGDRKKAQLARLRSMFEHIRAQCSESGPTSECLIPKLALATGSLSEPVHAAVKCAYQQWSALLAQVLREAQTDGEVDAKHDVDRLANVLVMLWEGAAIRMQIDRDIAPLDDFLDFAFDSILRAPK